MGKKKMPARVHASGWVAESDRSTVRVYVRCSPELAAEVRAFVAKRGLGLATVLEVGLAELSKSKAKPSAKGGDVR